MLKDGVRFEREGLLFMRHFGNHDQYDTYEIHPCLLLDANGKPVKNDDPKGVSYEQCQEDDPHIAVWSVYGHIPGQGLESISDHPTKEAAQIAIIALIKAADSLKQKRQMIKKTITIWLILFGGGFGSGYWLDERANQRSFRDRYTQSLGWAISEGILTVNQDRLADMDGLEKGDTNDAANTENTENIENTENTETNGINKTNETNGTNEINDGQESLSS